MKVSKWKRSLAHETPGISDPGHRIPDSITHINAFAFQGYMSPEGITLFVNPPSHSRWTQIP